MNRIKEFLDLRGMTQRQLAEKVGVTEVTISRYIGGKRVPRTKVADAMAQALGTDIAMLMGYDEKPLLNHVEMIIDYITDGTDFQYADNHGVLVRCGFCQWWDSSPSTAIAPEYHRCRRVGGVISMTAEDFCSRGIRR